MFSLLKKALSLLRTGDINWELPYFNTFHFIQHDVTADDIKLKLVSTPDFEPRHEDIALCRPLVIRLLIWKCRQGAQQLWRESERAVKNDDGGEGEGEGGEGEGKGKVAG